MVISDLTVFSLNDLLGINDMEVTSKVVVISELVVFSDLVVRYSFAFDARTVWKALLDEISSSPKQMHFSYYIIHSILCAALPYLILSSILKLVNV